MIPFNKPHVTGQESRYIADVLSNAKLSGDGPYTKKSQALLEKLLGSGKCLLTTSCTDALEAAALLCELELGDEVIVPSFTFVSTANAFALRGAKIRFADSLPNNPNIDPASVASLISSRTRAIVPVHYAGVACDMDALAAHGDGKGIFVVEDAAQAIASFYKGRPLGTIGDFSAFSFHETKNIVSGEGGALHINRPDKVRDAEIVREKGTDRSAFFRGEVDKYGWVALGSSFLPSELIAAFLLAQLEAVDDIQSKRLAAWQRYREQLADIEQSGDVQLPQIPNFATNNAHMFYVLCEDLGTRSKLIAHLKAQGVMAVFHYQTLHDSPYFRTHNAAEELPNATRYAETLLRLPLFADISETETDHVVASVKSFFGK